MAAGGSGDSYTCPSPRVRSGAAWQTDRRRGLRRVERVAWTMTKWRRRQLYVSALVVIHKRCGMSASKWVRGE